mmetsp:Transcript_22268/g.35919  ORF Transcript_22268/g.35919 Transcript_22268/m.35919 type:complete len:108 (-) Transcript_22268:366-689(-)
MTEVAPNLDELIEYFKVTSALESDNFNAFVASRMGEQSVSALFGISDKTTEKLAGLGIHKAWQLLGSVLNSKKEETVDMLLGLGISTSYAKRIAFGLLLNFRRSTKV